MKLVIPELNKLPFVKRYAWKSSDLFIPIGHKLYTNPPDNTTLITVKNPDYQGNNALFNTFEKYPKTLPLLTPLGSLYASL
jgi:hypothetical protein